MPNGQQTTSASGTVVKVLSVALVGMAVTLSAGTVTAVGEGATALTGSASTSAVGSVTADRSRTLTGQAITSQSGVLTARGRSLVALSTGTVLADLIIPLLGQASPVGQGLITPNADGTVPLVGSESVTATGTLTTPNSLALTGLESTTATGTLTPMLRPTDPVGQAISSAQGAVSIAANNVTVNISGSEMVMAQGAVDSTPVLTGLASTSGIGSVVQSASVELNGQALFGGQGVLSVGQDPDDTYILSRQGSPGVNSTRALTGSAATGAQGSVGITGDVFQPLTGTESATGIGSVGVDLSKSVTGQSFASALNSLGAPGGSTLTGQAASVVTGNVFVTNDREAALTGVSSTFAIGSVGSALAPLLTGSSLTGSTGPMGRSGGNMQQALTGVGATMTRGTFGVIGQDPIRDGVSNEGCGVTSAVANEQNQPGSMTGGEGCFTESGTAREV